MIRSYRHMQGNSIHALDGEIGGLKDVYFDDSSWYVRYFVVEFGSWFSGKAVLVPPSVVSPYDGVSLKISLTKAELRSCPDADTAIPVSLQERYPPHANLVYSECCMSYGGLLIVPPTLLDAIDVSENDPHLRSCKNMNGYTLVARDGVIGKIEDILLDDSFWLIRFIVSTVNDACGRREKLFDSRIIENIEWSLSAVTIAADRKEALRKPDFDPGRYLDTSYEAMVKEIL